MRMTPSILLVAVAAALAGCNDANDSQQTKTVGWFFDHRDELAGNAQGVPRQPW